MNRLCLLLILLISNILLSYGEKTLASDIENIEMNINDIEETIKNLEDNKFEKKGKFLKKQEIIKRLEEIFTNFAIDNYSIEMVGREKFDDLLKEEMVLRLKSSHDLVVDILKEFGKIENIKLSNLDLNNTGEQVELELKLVNIFEMDRDCIKNKNYKTNSSPFSEYQVNEIIEDKENKEIDMIEQDSFVRKVEEKEEEAKIGKKSLASEKDFTYNIGDFNKDYKIINYRKAKKSSEIIELPLKFDYRDGNYYGFWIYSSDESNYDIGLIDSNNKKNLIKNIRAKEGEWEYIELDRDINNIKSLYIYLPENSKVKGYFLLGAIEEISVTENE